MEKRKRNKLIGLSIVILFALVLVMPGVFAFSKSGEWVFSSEASTLATVTVTGLDENGDVVPLPVGFSAFKVGEVYISSLKVDVSWISTGRGVQWDTFNFDGEIRFSYLNAYDHWIEESSYPVISTDKEGLATHTFVLGTDICKAENILYGGWFIEGKFTGSATITDDLGNVLTAYLPALAGTMNVVWDADFGLGGTWDWTTE